MKKIRNVIRYYVPLCFSEFCGFFCLAVGWASLVGHYFRMQHLYAWTEGDPGMAVSTSVCFVLIGISKIVLAAYAEAERNGNNKL